MSNPDSTIKDEGVLPPPPPTKPENDWVLNSLNINRINYGDKCGKYKGSMKFINGTNESFEFNIDEDLQGVLLKLIAPQISKSANEMATRLQKSITGEVEKSVAT